VKALGGGWRDSDLPAPIPIGGIDQTPQPAIPPPGPAKPPKEWWQVFR